MPATASSALRAEVRAVLRGAPPFVPQPDAWLMGHAPLLTSALGEAGLIGVTWPEAYGGRAASARDRMIVTEELLRVGAPVAAHWVADRQIGPAVLRYGSDQLRKALLPGIAAGDITFCLGMSEPDSGSDLAAVRTRAIPVDGGFEVTGRKIWTSNAHRSTHAYVLARLPAVEAKHEGLTELVVDLGSPGIEISPILDLSGEHHFNEMVLDKVFVPADNVIGTPGDGWRQVTEQLAHERGGVERVFSSYPVLDALLTGNAVPARLCEALGAVAARLHALRGMAEAVASAADEGGASVRQAAMLKLLGTEHEAAVTDLGRRVLAGAPVAGRSILDTLVAKGIARAPGATLRGGTTEVLLGILARDANAPALADPLARLV